MKRLFILITWLLLLGSCNNPAEEEYYKKGDASGKAKDYKDAITQYDKAIELNPKLAKAYNGRGV